MKALRLLGRAAALLVYLACLAISLLWATFARAANYELVTEEATFQLAHVIDLQQTLDLKHPRPGHYHWESGNALDGGWLIGPHPSDAKVYAYFAGEAILHLAVSAALAHCCRPWAVRIWEVTTISVQGVTIARNAHIGLRVHF